MSTRDILTNHPKLRECLLTLRILSRNPSAVAGAVILTLMLLLRRFRDMARPV